MNLGFRQFLSDLKERRYRFRQILGGLFALTLVLIARPGGWMLWPGVVITAIGLFFRLWAAGHVQKSQVLATDGPYSIVRHPQYLGNSLIAVGLSLASGHPVAILVWVLLFYLFYVPAVRREDRKLHRRFGKDWEQWHSRTPAVLPRLCSCSLSGMKSGAWSLKLAIINGEPIWQTLISAALIVILTKTP